MLSANQPGCFIWLVKEAEWLAGWQLVKDDECVAS